ncbi:MAG: LytR family transcriptional regulator [Actinobacteria bacterium]|nr:LytR family transcriptional regulator [Actinomycetota bacterium]
MSPDDRSKHNNEENYEEDIFKKYSFDENKSNDYEDEDNGEIINTGRHAKRFPEEQSSIPEEESRNQAENDFFTDRDFEFSNEYGDEWDDDGARSTKIREKRRKRRFIFTSITVMVLLVLLSTGIVFGYRYIKNKYFPDTSGSQTSQAETSIEIPSSIKLGRDLSIIIAGADSNLVEPQIKSLILSKYTVSDSRLVSLCMPVNALFEIPGFGQDTIKKAAGFGGMDLMKLAVKNNLGVNAEKYLLMDVISIVNKLESIKLELSSEIEITNPDGSKTLLKEGENIINGETAYNFLSYYSGENPDVSPSATGFQKILTDSIMKKIAGSREGDLAGNLSKIKDYIETDLSLEELAEIIATISQLKSEKNKIYTLDGRVVPLDEAGNIVIVPDISKVSSIFGLEGAVIEEEPVYETGQTVSVTVLNGVGTKGIAGQVSELLKGLKFSDGKPRYEMQAPGDAENYNFSRTMIIIKSENDANTRASSHLTEVLMASASDINADQASDIVVIVGKDFDYNAVKANIENIAGGQTVETGSTETTEESAAQPQTYVLSILNGEGTTGLALTVKKILEDKLNSGGKVIEVKEVKNADNQNYSTTKIIIHKDKSGIEDIADRIRDVLDVGEISKSTDNPDNVDITVIVGSDYTK